MWCWGDNGVGEVGDGTTITRPQPTKVSLPKPAMAISAGGLVLNGTGTTYSAHTCAILADGTLQCWGSNTDGELGLGDLAAHQGPQTVPIGNVKQVSARFAHTCAINALDDLYCWGRNGFGQIGVGTTQDVLTPTKIASAVTTVANGGRHTCMVRSGSLYCWGWNGYGQLGDGSTTPTTQPGAPAVAGLSGNVVEIVNGRYSTFARTTVGVYSWGYNAGGDLGIGTTTNEFTPQPVSLTGTTQLAFGTDHGGAVTPSTLFLWGVNVEGQIGDGTAVNRPSPTPITSVSEVVAVTASDASTCALTKSNHMYCWGSNTYGELGNGTTIDSSTPTPVVWP